VSGGENLVLDAQAIGLIIRRMAAEILERTRGTRKLGFVGVRRGGVPIAARIAAEILQIEQRTIPVGSIDIALYRDDAASALPSLKLGPSEIDYAIDGWDVVLIDDVLHTGRTTRAGIDALLDYGRARRIWLAVLCDRGGRELPIAPDFAGCSVQVPPGFVLDVVADGGEADRAVVRKKGEDA
jgi:pyrimidine operon attenuation protein / uracil phosphoribosyltransferase